MHTKIQTLFIYLEKIPEQLENVYSSIRGPRAMDCDDCTYGRAGMITIPSTKEIDDLFVRYHPKLTIVNVSATGLI